MACGPASKLTIRNPVAESCSSSRFDVFEEARAAGASLKVEANALPRLSVVSTPCVRFDTDGANPTQTCWISRGPYPRTRLPSLWLYVDLPAANKASMQGNACIHRL